MTGYAVRFAQALNDKHMDHHGYFDVLPGRKYDRIIYQDTHPCSGMQKHVYVFVDRKTGDVIKAATWSSPQRDKDGLAVRFNLATTEGFIEAVDAADKHGGAFYKR